MSESIDTKHLFRSNHRRAVAQPCVNGDRLSKGRIAKFDPAQIRNTSTDRHKIWNRWLCRRDDPPCKISCKSVHWGLLGKCVKYNENFSSIYIPFLLTDLQVRPVGGFSRTMAQTTRSHAFLEVENSKLISNPWNIPPKSKIWQKTDKFSAKNALV